MTDISGKIVFITGASSGIGKACAESFASSGANLIITARRKERLNLLSETLSKKYGIKVLSCEMDVRRQEVVERTVGDLPENWKDIDILVNNAGLGYFSKLQDGKISDWEEMIDTNIKGLLYVTRTILGIMVQRNSGHVITIGSLAGHEVYPMGNVYCATKWASNALNKALRVDLLGTKIRVTSIDPGMVETDFRIVSFRGDTERAKQFSKGLIPLSPEDIADAVVYAASRPWHVNIREMILYPTMQVSAMLIHREDE
jgi:NADP-dependent 3-hydroxy acid dehydrogenase YdfG